LKKLIIVFCSIILLNCNKNINENLNIIFYSPYNVFGVWIGNNKIDFAILKEIDPLIIASFDEIARNLWAFSFSEDNRHIYYFNITDGIFIKENKITIERPEKLYLCKAINNNKVLYSTDGRNYIIIDLYTQIQKEFIINDIDGRIPMGFPQDPIGFSDNYVIFRNGYYNISEYEYVFFNDLRYPRFIADKNKIIGLNSLNDIVIYDLTTKSKNKTSIKREIKKGVKYNGNDLYFLENDDLFVSKDMNGFSNIIRMFLPPSFTKREWYKYDLNTGKRSKIFSPDDMVVILGKF
jgi:hypothetical protein